MHVDKILLTIILCATNVCCGEQTLIRNARTFDSSSFTWPQALFSNLPNVFPKLWPSSSQLQEWTRAGVISLLRLAFSGGSEQMHIEFKPEDGLRAAKFYQQRYGYRGERLVEQLGNGFDPDIRLNRQPSSLSTFLMPPPNPFRRASNPYNARAFKYI
ncbi:hypothetical protein PUN28_020076 [Cardiocondyla obscurior]|uniref:Uncharacterized protein n=1 Tax=Cardiocondyla obscurior TaxID=286306 RepID=A0AAW2E8C4_9HYME